MNFKIKTALTPVGVDAFVRRSLIMSSIVVTDKMKDRAARVMLKYSIDESKKFLESISEKVFLIMLDCLLEDLRADCRGSLITLMKDR